MLQKKSDNNEMIDIGMLNAKLHVHHKQANASDKLGLNKDWKRFRGQRGNLVAENQYLISELLVRLSMAVNAEMLKQNFQDGEGLTSAE